MTPKAVKEAALWVYVEAGRLLFVEGAQPDIAPPSFLQPYRFTYQLDDRRLTSDTVESLLPDHRGHIPQKSCSPSWRGVELTGKWFKVRRALDG